MAEAGVKGAEFSGGRFGLLAPAGTPLPIVDKLAAEIRTALMDPQVKERLGALGLRPVGSSPKEFRRLVESEVKYFAELVREIGIQAE